MTRKQIEYLIKTHEGQRDFAKAYLDKFYYELEERDKEREWVDRWTYHRNAVEELKRATPDDQ